MRYFIIRGNKIAYFYNFYLIFRRNLTMEIEEKQEEEEMQMEMCMVCGGTPCDWEVYGEGIVADLKAMYHLGEEEAPEADNRTIRKSAYRLFIYCKYGHLGKGNRVRIAPCITDRIRELWPEKEEEEYTGYHSS